MQKNLLTFLALLTTVGLSACSDGSQGDVPSNDTGSGGEIAAAISSLQASGELPVLNRDPELSGPDEDQNLIRDDIDNYLLNLPVTSQQMEALQSIASSLQKIQTVSLDNVEIAEQLSNEFSLPITCLADAFGASKTGHEYLKKLEAYTANTPSRAQQYIKYNELRNGSVSRLPDPANCPG